MNIARVEEVTSDGTARTLYTAKGLESTDSIDGAALLLDVEAFVSRFVVLPQSALLPAAIWVIGTYIFSGFETFPYLALLSPEKGCGKTPTSSSRPALGSKVSSSCEPVASRLRMAAASG